MTSRRKEPGSGTSGPTAVSFNGTHSFACLNRISLKVPKTYKNVKTAIFKQFFGTMVADGRPEARCFGWLTLRFVIAMHPASLTGLTVDRGKGKPKGGSRSRPKKKEAAEFGAERRNSTVHPVHPSSTV